MGWAMVALVMLLGAGVLWYRATLHNWPWQGDPAEFSACGRNYAIDGTSAPPSYRLYPVFRAFPIIGPEVYSAESPSHRAKLRKSGEGACDGTVLFIEDSPRRFTAYALNGGP
jgi:hypothetical protein